MHNSNKNDWHVSFEVTFYGNDPANVEIKFLLWVETLSIEKLTNLSHDYHVSKIYYD